MIHKPKYDKLINNIAFSIVQMEHQNVFSNQYEYDEFIMDHFYKEHITQINRAKILYKIYMLCHYYRSYK